MKILYCISGGGFYGVVSEDITNQSDMRIDAKRVFSLEPSAETIQSPRGMRNSGFMISVYNNVMLECSLIAVMDEKAVFHQKITEIVEQEKRNVKEN